MKLPNAQNAVVDIAKLRDYCLNPNHPKGKHKARAFLDKLGLERNDAEYLRQAILEGILEAEAVEEEATGYGRRFVVDLELQRGVGVIWHTQLFERHGSFEVMKTFRACQLVSVPGGVFSYERNKVA
jgi:uncharacterized protein DUF6883